MSSGTPSGIDGTIKTEGERESVQRPLNRLLDLWNGIFDCHQAEITVMQFRGHSLLEYQSMSVSRDFSTLSLFIS